VRARERTTGRPRPRHASRTGVNSPGWTGFRRRDRNTLHGEHAGVPRKDGVSRVNRRWNTNTSVACYLACKVQDGKTWCTFSFVLHPNRMAGRVVQTFPTFPHGLSFFPFLSGSWPPMHTRFCIFCCMYLNTMMYWSYIHFSCSI
jgi:hypothetical protein